MKFLGLVTDDGEIIVVRPGQDRTMASRYSYLNIPMSSVLFAGVAERGDYRIALSDGSTVFLVGSVERELISGDNADEIF